MAEVRVEVPAAAPTIAVICLGHQGNPAGIVRLAQYFAAAGGHLYVHIDAKTPLAPYLQACEGLANVSLIARRHIVYWAGFSMILAIMEAVRAAMLDADYMRYCFITEDSIPLVPAGVFAVQMTEPYEYILLQPNSSPAIVQRYAGFFFLDSPATNARTPPEQRFVTPELSAALHRLEVLRERGKLPIDRLFHGPAHWALSARAMTEVLIHHENSHHLRASFEFSCIPDEQYVQTILGNAARRFSFRPFMHADFTREPRPYIYRTSGELALLQATPTLFARKGDLASADVTAFVDHLSRNESVGSSHQPSEPGLPPG